MDEYIERKSALNQFTYEHGDLIPEVRESGEESVIAVRDVKAVLRSLPAVDVEKVVHGRWIVSDIDYGFCDAIKKNYTAKEYQCSVCGYKTGNQAEKFVCCPICTARMDR